MSRTLRTLTAPAALAPAMVARGLLYVARGTVGWDEALARVGTMATNGRGEAVMIDGVVDPGEARNADGLLPVHRPGVV